MKFVGTSPWMGEGGGYEFRLLEDGTLVHLHEADISKIDYRRESREIRLYFRYDRDYVRGVLCERPVIRMQFAGCDIIEWAVDMPTADERNEDTDLSVKMLDLQKENMIVFESVPARIVFTTSGVMVQAVSEVPDS